MATITAEAYQPHVTPDTRVATIIQTSPVTGMSVDVKAVARTIRAVAPSCFIIVDGIQHAAHGVLSVADYDVDAFTVSGYKMYSRHNYGVAWVSPRMSRLKHERLDGTAEDHWELGTRDTAAYATFSDVVNYLEWLGATFTDVSDRRARLIKAGEVMQAQEAALVDRMIEGNGDLVGLRGLPGVKVIGGCDNPHREGLVSFAADGVPSSTIVDRLNEAGVRTHVRKDDHFSGNILKPLALKDCVRVSLCHYNSADEVDRFLSAMGEILSAVNVAASVA
jgi:cysteine desulfurase/selenocysteine lyase